MNREENETKGRGRTLGLRLDASAWATIRDLAKAEHLSASAWARRALLRAVSVALSSQDRV